MATKYKFTLTKNNIDSSGDRVVVSGIDLKRAANDSLVCLWNHRRDVLPIGKWSGIELIADGQDEELVGFVQFDNDDDFAMQIANKVENGYISTCSVRLRIKSMQYVPATEEEPEHFLITKSELLECSMCDIPMNAEATAKKSFEERKKEVDAGGADVYLNVKIKSVDGQAPAKQKSTGQTADENRMAIEALNKDKLRLQKQVADLEKQIDALVNEKTLLSQSHVEGMKAKEAQISTLISEKARLEVDKQALKGQLVKAELENDMNLALATLRGSNGAPLDNALISEIKNAFKAQHQINKSDDGTVSVFSITQNKVMDGALTNLIVNYAYDNRYIARPQGGSGYVRTSTEAPYEDKNKGQRIEEVRKNLRDARVPEYSDDWYKAMHEAGWNIPEAIKSKLGLP